MTSRFLTRPLSHSQLSSFAYSPEGWYRSYILNEREPANEEMKFGNRIGDAIGTPDSPIPELTPPGIKEYPLYGEIEGIKLIGYADHLCDQTWTLHENKTSYKASRWNQSKVDTHPQLTMYAYLINHTHGVPPEEVTMYLNFIQARHVGVGYQLHEPPRWQQFTTKRTQADLASYRDYVLVTVEAMQRYIDQMALSTPVRRPPVFNAV
jgi:hypothetical protein